MVFSPAFQSARWVTLCYARGYATAELSPLTRGNHRNNRSDWDFGLAFVYAARFDLTCRALDMPTLLDEPEGQFRILGEWRRVEALDKR